MDKAELQQRLKTFALRYYKLTTSLLQLREESIFKINLCVLL